MGKKKPNKRKAKVKVRQSAQIVRKDSTQLKSTQVQMPRDNGLNMRVKIKRKNK